MLILKPEILELTEQFSGTSTGLRNLLEPREPSCLLFLQFWERVIASCHFQLSRTCEVCFPSWVSLASLPPTLGQEWLNSQKIVMKKGPEEVKGGGSVHMDEGGIIIFFTLFLFLLEVVATLHSLPSQDIRL